MKKTPFVFVYTNGHEWKEFVSSMELKGIRISPRTVVSTTLLSVGHSAGEAATRGLLNREYEKRLELLSEDDLYVLRTRCAEFNAMLRACDASFRVPLDGACWVGCNSNRPKAICFQNGEEVADEYGWALYKYLL